MEAIEELCDDSPDNKFYWYGPGWNGWDILKTASENIKDAFDGNSNHINLIVAYKPLDIYKADELHKEYKCCLNYNEMYDVDWTKKEIKYFGATLVICHHYNDWEKFNHYPSLNAIEFHYIPHSADEKAFKQWSFDGVQLPKIYDVMLVGAYNVSNKFGNIYPLRDRLSKLLPKIAPKYRWGIFNHPSYEREDANSNQYAEFFSKALNSTRIAVCDSSIFKYRLGKYIEVPASGTVLAADMPMTHPVDQEALKNVIIDINMDMSDQEIIDTIAEYLEDDTKYNLKVKNGLEYAKAFTCESYATKFLDIITDLYEDTNTHPQ
jgi:hypothetical protein